MKRKLLSLVCILLTLCIFLSSCAAGGALQPPFLKLLGGSLSTFFSDAGNLLSGNRPLILNGRINYRLDSDGTAPEDVAALLSAIKEKTGCDLAENTDGTAPRLRIGLGLHPALKASAFFVGFYENELLITAASDVMLTEAIRYFTQNHVLGEKANCGNGYLYIAGDLAYTSATIPVIEASGEPAFTVVSPENADKATYAAVTKLISSVRGATSVNLSVQDNYFKGEGSADAKEILIGLTTRVESIEATDNLDDYSYHIGITESKVIITAKNAYLLDRAVEHFCELFVTSENADASYEARTLSLPASLSYTHTERILVLSNASVTPYALIYPAGADERLLSAIDRLCGFFYYLTGATLPVYSDAQSVESGDNVTEILIGATNRHASVLAGVRLGPADWAVTTAGKRLVVHGGSTNPICEAIDRLIDELYKLSEQQNPKSNSDGYDPRPLLCYPEETALAGINAPDIPSLTGYTEIGESAYMLYRTGCNAEDLAAYLSTLTASGYKLHQQRAVGALSAATLYSDNEILNVTFSLTDNTLRVAVDPRTESALPPIVEKHHQGRTNVEPLFIQLGGMDALYLTKDCGMSYVVRLTDGTFIVVDGGWTDSAIAKQLYNALGEHNVLGEKPVIRCWIFTHAHVDHIGAFKTFTEKYADKVELQSVSYSFPTSAQAQIHGGRSVVREIEAFRGYIAQYGEDVTVYKARTGQLYEFADCSLEMLFSLEDYEQPKRLTNFNDSSLVFAMTLSDAQGTSQRFMMLGDCSVASAAILVARYGNYLQSDVVQVAHHGYDGGTAALYDAVSAAVVFWPCPLYNPQKPSSKRFDDPKWSKVTRVMLGQEYAKVLYVSGSGSVCVTLEDLQLREIVGIGMAAADAKYPS
jgi:beta-lactamase superfamily II metal-dependent hydrolase